MDWSSFREALSEESDYMLTDELFNSIIDHSELLSFNRGDAIIDIGKMVPDVYIIAEGVVRGYLFQNGTENNICFGLTGTLITSMHCFSRNEPSILRIEACSRVKVLRIRKRVFDTLVEKQSGFAMWVAGVFTRRGYFSEVKAKIMSGDALWRYKALKNMRPELLENVPMKAIASYLGMSEVHVSRIKKAISTEQKGKQTDKNPEEKQR